jgi:hypothetical protein
MENTGGCACGAVKYQVSGEPFRMSICYCRECQLRTGSAFGIQAIFPADGVKITKGTTKIFERTADSGNWIKFHFCDNCGTTMMYEAEVFPGGRGIAVGTLDNSDWVEPNVQVYKRSRQNWMPVFAHIEALETSNVGKK